MIIIIMYDILTDHLISAWQPVSQKKKKKIKKENLPDCGLCVLADYWEKLKESELF